MTLEHRKASLISQFLVAFALAIFGLTTALLIGEIALRLADRPATAVIGWKSGARTDEQNEF